MSDRERKEVEEDAIALGYPEDRVKKITTGDLIRFIRSRQRRRPERPPRRSTEEFVQTLKREDGYTEAEEAQIQLLLSRKTANDRPIMGNSDNPRSIGMEPLDIGRLISEDDGINLLERTVSGYLDRADNLSDALKCYAELLSDESNSLCPAERNDLSRRAKIDAESIGEIKTWCEAVVDSMKDVITVRMESAARLRDHRASSEHMDRRTKLLQILHSQFCARCDTLVAHLRTH